MFAWEDWDKSLENGQDREEAANENNRVTGWDIEGLVEDKEALVVREMTAGWPTLTD